ncbi:MAG: dioxygenase [Alphaproteobacteria bacterium]|nr:dioxygenase [Alphaproteobacteria bacterium]
MAARPALFVSHGSPMLMFEPVRARDFLSRLGSEIGRPKAIVAVSAHWETAAPRASIVGRPSTIHDFGGFPDELYQVQYPAPGAPEAARRAVDLLGQAGITAATDPARGLDHGAWVPLALMYPTADVPVAQLSIQTPLGPVHHVAVGRALAPLRGEDVLVFATGGATHNLYTMERGVHDSPPAWALEFDDWLAAKLEAGDEESLVNYRRRAPYAREAHPRDEHLLPVFVAFGAGGPGAKGRSLHRSFTHGSLSMAAFAFE